MSSPEHRSAPPSAELPPRTFREQMHHSLREAKRMIDIANALFVHEDTQKGAEATLRAVINTGISLADTIPVFGEIASWGADIAKIVEDFRYKRRRKEAKKRGEDPDLVVREKFNLTPDVPTWVAVGTEVLEFFTGGFFPSHAIETTWQLAYDAKDIYRALRAARRVLNEAEEQHREAEQAANVFLSDSDPQE